MTENETVKVMETKKEVFPYKDTIERLAWYLNKPCRTCKHTECKPAYAIDNVQRLKQFGIVGFTTNFLLSLMDTNKAMTTNRVS